MLAQEVIGIPEDFQEIQLFHGQVWTFSLILRVLPQILVILGGVMILADICLATRMMS